MVPIDGTTNIIKPPFQTLIKYLILNIDLIRYQS